MFFLPEYTDEMLTIEEAGQLVGQAYARRRSQGVRELFERYREYCDRMMILYSMAHESSGYFIYRADVFDFKQSELVLDTWLQILANPEDLDRTAYREWCECDRDFLGLLRARSLA